MAGRMSPGHEACDETALPFFFRVCFVRAQVELYKYLPEEKRNWSTPIINRLNTQ